MLANDPTVSAVVLDIDSPGGQVTGTPEAASAVYAARQRKPVIASVGPLAASAAYWIAAAASQVIMPATGEVGSIGAFVMHLDASRMFDQQGITVTAIHNEQSPYKTEGGSWAPLGSEARAFQQKQLNAIGGDFIAAVAHGRKTTIDDVTQNMGGGRTVMGRDAVRLNMADAIGGFELAYGRATIPGPVRAERLAQRREPATEH